MIPVMLVPVLNGYDKLQKMLDSIDYPIEHIIILDNGGKLKSLECKFAKELSIINFPYNLGIATPYNIGIKLTPMAKYWLFAQNDIIWLPNGLEKIDKLSGSNVFGIDMDGIRPFACRTIGENVVSKVGLLDESYFPAPGDDTNYHKRCHYYNIEQVNIGGTFLAENSSTIISMLLDGSISLSTWADNENRSFIGPPIDSGWNLSRRRKQGLHSKDDVVPKDLINKLLYSEHKVHNAFENAAFKLNNDRS